MTTTETFRTIIQTKFSQLSTPMVFVSSLYSVSRIFDYLIVNPVIASG
jgi:hypothetical protein